MPKIWIFLDIDGVLATSKTYKTWTPGDDPGDLIDLECLANLKKLLDYAPNAELILSSSWRCHHGMRRALANRFRKMGMQIWREEVDRVQYDRQDEINDHITGNLLDGDYFIILDDIEMEYEHLRDWQVHCYYSGGFDETQLEAAKNLVDLINESSESR